MQRDQLRNGKKSHHPIRHFCHHFSYEQLALGCVCKGFESPTVPSPRSSNARIFRFFALRVISNVAFRLSADSASTTQRKAVVKAA